MSLRLVKVGTDDEYSPNIGDPVGTDPVQMGQVIITTVPPPADYTVATVETTLKATTYNYTAINVTLISENANINYEISPNGSTGWANSLAIADQDATGGDQLVPIFVRTTVLNDPGTPAGIQVQCKIRVDAIENQG